jgi:hypothetical protein
MGYIRHNAIIATAWQEEAATALYTYANEIGAQAVMAAADTNGYITVCVMPDGSKEGWATSDEGDAHRAAIRAWLEQAGSRDMYFEWCEVVYGSDDAKASIVDSAWGAPA